MGDAGAHARCSFCGEPDHALAEGGGDDVGLPVVGICADCARGAVAALHTEERLDEAQASMPPPAPAAAPGTLGTLIEWTPFTMDGATFEWSARREVVVVEDAEQILSLRGPPIGDGALAIHVPDDTEPDAELVRHVVRGLIRAKPAATTGALREWTALDVDGRALEWRVVREPTTRARTIVRVSVRDPATGRSVSMERSGAIEPTVEDAVMAATAWNAEPDT